VDALQGRCDLRCRRPDLVDEAVAAVRVAEPAAARAADRREQTELHAREDRLHQPDVVAADADRDERRVGTQRVELRRVDPDRHHVLRSGHVLGRRSRAAPIAKLRDAGRGGDDRRVVVVRAQTPRRLADDVEDPGRGGVGIAERDVRAGARLGGSRERQRREDATDGCGMPTPGHVGQYHAA
jgi:hypothetical protein